MFLWKSILESNRLYFTGCALAVQVKFSNQVSDAAAHCARPLADPVCDDLWNGITVKCRHLRWSSDRVPMRGGKARHSSTASCAKLVLVYDHRPKPCLFTLLPSAPQFLVHYPNLSFFLPPDPAYLTDRPSHNRVDLTSSFFSDRAPMARGIGTSK